MPMIFKSSSLARVLVLGLLSVFASCGGCGLQPPNECGLHITFESPIDQATVSATTDIVVLVDSNGAAIDLSAADLGVRLDSESSFAPAIAGALEKGKATFSAVALKNGTNVLRIDVKQKDSACVADKTIVVNVGDTGIPEVQSFRFVGDTGNDKILNSIELPAGSKVSAALQIANANLGIVRIKEQGGAGTQYGQATINNGMATVELSLPNLVDATYNLVAEVTNVSGNKNDLNTNIAARVTLRVKTSVPTVTLTAPTRDVVGPGDDADLTKALFQLHVSATAVGSVASIELIVSDTSQAFTSGPQPPAGNNSLTQDFDLKASGTTRYTVRAIAKDSAGNTGSAETSITVDFDPPSINITSPTAAMGTQTSFNVPLSATVQGADNQFVYFFSDVGGNRRQLGSFRVTNGVASGTGSLVNGAQTIVAQVSDSVGNSSSDSENITVSAPGCPLIFSKPASNPAVLTPKNDASPATPDLQYQLVVTSTPACSGGAVSITRPGVATPVGTGTIGSSGDFTAQISLPNGDYDFTAVVTDPANAARMTTVTQHITISLSTVALTSPTDNFTLRVGQDQDLSLPGVQFPLAYQPPAPTGSTVTMCTSINLLPTSTPCPDGEGFVLATNVAQSVLQFTFPDGTYWVKPVIVTGSATSSGDKTNLIVDSVRPKVTAFAFQQDLNNDLKVNAAEQSSGSPSAVLAFSGVENGITVSVKLQNTAVVVGTATVTNNAAVVPLNGLGLTATTEADYLLYADVSDAVGNPNQTGAGSTADPKNAAAFTSLRVDRVKPTTVITSPVKPVLGSADDAIAGGTYQLRVAAQTATDVKTNGVKFDLAGAATQTGNETPAAGLVSHDFDVASTGTLSYTVTVRSTDESGNVGDPVTASISVDNDAPTCAITSPTSGGSPYSAFTQNTSVTVGGAEGQLVKIFSTPAASSEVQVGGFSVTGGVAQGSVTYPGGAQTVRAEVKDTAGNVCNATQSITITAPGCPILITAPAVDPATLNATDDTAPASPTTLEYSLKGVSIGCPSKTVTVFRGSGGSRTTLGTATTDGAGVFSFSLSLAEGSHHIEAEVNNGSAVLTFDAVDLTVDLTPPGLSAVSPTGATLFYVAAQNSHFVAPVDPQYVADADPMTAGAQLTVSGTVTGAVGGTFSILYGASTVAGPLPVSNPTQTFTVPITLPQSSTGNLVIQVKDAAGNATSQTSSTTIDVVAPGVPTVTKNVVAGQERTAQVSLSWTMTNDDGTDSASGGHQGYDVRWTTQVAGDTGLASNADYFDPAKMFTASVVPWSSTPGAALVVSVPPLSRYWFYVRAKDEVGNYSDFTVDGAPLDNFGTTATFSNPRPGALATDVFGRALAAGQLNTDGIDDLAVGASKSHKVYVYYGQASLGTVTPQEVLPPGGLDGGDFGTDVSIGNVGDTASEGKPDLLVGAPGAASAAGRAFVFFGTSGAQVNASGAPGTYVEFQGNTGSRLGHSARTIEDLNGDGKRELVLGAWAESSNRGRFYVFMSRPAAAWIAGSPWTMDKADRIIDAPNPPNTNAFFGFHPRSVGSIGALDGGLPDFTIGGGWGTVNKAFIFSGAQFAAADAGAVFTTGESPIPNMAMQTLSTAANPTATLDGFGVRILGGQQLIGTTAPDILITYPNLREVRIFGDRLESTGFPSTETMKISGSTVPSFGTDVATIDYNMDGKLDLVIGNGSSAGQYPLWVFFNTGLNGTEFNTDVTPLKGSAKAKLSSAGRTGLSVAVGDFNGDGKPDIAASDERDGAGKVFVWY